MKALRRAFGLVGGVALALAVASLLGASVPLPVEAVVAAIGNDYMFVAGFAAVAAVVVVAVLGLRAVSGVTQSRPPDPERVVSAPRPGEAFDRYVEDGLPLHQRLFADDGERVRDRLRETAVETTMRAEDCDRDTARELVETGEWTDDSEAAAFVADGSASSSAFETGATPSAIGLAGRVSAAFRGESAFQRGARRTASAITEKAGEEGR